MWLPEQVGLMVNLEVRAMKIDNLPVQQLLDKQGVSNVVNRGEQKGKKEVSREFAAFFYREMLKSMQESSAIGQVDPPGQKKELWWDFMLREMSLEMAKAPSSFLTKHLYGQISKKS